jgi:hypothetical protein
MQIESAKQPARPKRHEARSQKVRKKKPARPRPVVRQPQEPPQSEPEDLYDTR